MAILLSECCSSRAPLIEITGGEPLLQEGTPVLARQISEVARKRVLVETNGSCDLSVLPTEVIAIVDLKTPGSGETGSIDWGNIARLRPHDEIKFVLCDRADYEWALSIVADYDLCQACRAVHFGPAWNQLDPTRLAHWMIEDMPPVRLHLPLHKMAGIP
jgi:7-carboxy-7-deazaguanine synthase